MVCFPAIDDSSSPLY